MKMGGLRGYQGYFAGFTSRLVAMIMDTVILVLAYVGLTWFIAVSVKILPIGRVFGFSLSALLGQEGSGQLVSTGTVIAVFTLSTIVYYVFFWTITGQTLGMILMGLRVVTIEGRRLTAWRAIIRFIGYIIAALPFCLGFAWILVDNRRQGWHDKIAGTYVAYIWAAKPDERFLVRANENIEEKHDAKSSNLE
jgi:uncharacterized RDD family membrane protein YckC